MQSLPAPNVVDIAVLIIVVASAIVGIRRGLSGELAHVVSLVVAFILGLYCYSPFSLWIIDHTRLTYQPARALAFITTVLAAAVAMILLRSLLKRIMKVAIEQGIDKAAGCVAGFVRSCIFVIIVVLIMNMWPNDYLNRVFGEESIIGTVVLKCMPSLREDEDSGSQGAKTGRRRWSAVRKREVTVFEP